MAKRILTLLVLSLALFVIPSWAQSAFCGDDSDCTTFDANHTSFTYNSFGDGSALTVQFETVLTSFSLRVAIHMPRPTDSSVGCDGGHPCSGEIMLDPTELPQGTLCVTYPGFIPGTCEQYDFTGDAGGGSNGVPVKNVNYKGLITLTLTYNTASTFTVRTPAFGHAPGDITTFTENILTSYSVDGPPVIGPTMGGKVPGLSSLVALDEPLADGGTDAFCSLTLTSTNNSSGQKAEIEATLKIAGTSACGTGIRDKSASLSLSNDSTGTVIFVALKNAEGNKFHWDNKNGLNEYDISLDGLSDGKYTVTVFASKISPQKTTFCLASGVVTTPCP